jgi:hypothetical protein
LALVVLLPGAAAAQLNVVQAGTLSSQTAPLSAGPGTAGQATPGASLVAPGGGLAPATQMAPMPAVPAQVAPIVPPGQLALAVNAQFADSKAPVVSGLQWRVYADKPDATGVFRLVREDKAPAPTFVLPPGGYIVNVTFGLASAARPVLLRNDNTRESFDISAGGLRIEGRVGDVRIPAGQISFDIYKGSQFEPGDKRPLAQSVMSGDVVLLPEGTYHIVSNYGDANAVVRSDIRVQTGKLTDAIVKHRAAVITLKLVNEKGGESLANTAWSVLTPGGDVVKEAQGAFPRVVLAEGEYRVIARNEGSTYEREFKVVTGVDSELEVIAR